MLKILGALVLAGLAFLAAGLAWAHFAIRAVEPELPDTEHILAVGKGASDLPIAVHWINTASQPMSRGGVLEPSLDPNPDAEYVMGFPAFVLEWADGRLFLIDLGMERESALAFGAPSERLLGSESISFHTDVAAALGGASGRVAGVGFSHLHTDHTDGGIRLCAASERTIPQFQTPHQAELSNYTTRPGRALVERAGCLTPETLEGGPLYEMPGFPGLAVFATGGHTPGSQVFVARVADALGARVWIFTGDIVNHIDGVRLNLPKPTLYSLFVVPEHREQLERMRRLLADLGRPPDVELLVSHDLRQIEGSGLAAWPGDR
jgi:glyoxylase-like metal-dependent hydrolase (beta-lactamase superfamily II)